MPICSLGSSLESPMDWHFLILDIIVDCRVDFDEALGALVMESTHCVVSKTDNDHTLTMSDDVIHSKDNFGEKNTVACAFPRDCSFFKSYKPPGVKSVICFTFCIFYKS